MKRSTLLLVAGILAPTLLADVRPAEGVTFAPKADTSITKTFTTTSTFELDDMSFLLDGQDPGDMVPDIEMSTTLEQEVSVTDTYLSMGDGQPARLKRTYDDIGSDMEVDVVIDMMGQTSDESQSGEGTSELEGKTVVFAWDEDAGEYTKAYDEDESGDEDLLEGLREDMDLRALLPGEAVSEGDQWEIDLAGLADVLAPGGNLGIELDLDSDMPMGGPDPSMVNQLDEILGDLLEGEATCKWASTREVDGSTIAVIEISIDISAARDMSDTMADMMGEEMPEGIDVSFDRLDVEFTYEGGGTLLWNMSLGHAQGLELEGEVTMATEMEVTMNMGQEMVMEMSMEMSGEMAQSMSVE